MYRTGSRDIREKRRQGQGENTVKTERSVHGREKGIPGSWDIVEKRRQGQGENTVKDRKECIGQGAGT